MKYNLSHFSELMDKEQEKAPEAAKQINDLYRKLTADLKREVSSSETQDIVRKILALMAENVTVDFSASNYSEMIMNIYSDNDYVRAIADTKYGNGAADYITGAFGCYYNRQNSENGQ